MPTKKNTLLCVSKEKEIMESFRIELASEGNGGLDYILASSIREQWNPGRGDLHKLFYPMDPSGFFIGILHRENNPEKHKEEIIGCISGVALDDHHGFIGYYIVNPEHRGKYSNEYYEFHR